MVDALFYGVGAGVSVVFLGWFLSVPTRVFRSLIRG